MYVNQSILRALDRRCHLINRINQSQCMNLVVYASSERGVRNVFLPHLAALPKSRQPPSVTVCMRRRFHFHTFWTNRQDLWRNMEVDPPSRLGPVLRCCFFCNQFKCDNTSITLIRLVFVLLFGSFVARKYKRIAFGAFLLIIVLVSVRALFPYRVTIAVLCKSSSC